MEETYLLHVAYIINGLPTVNTCDLRVKNDANITVELLTRMLKVYFKDEIQVGIISWSKIGVQ